MASRLSLPSHDDPLARGASTLVGGPVGRHARIGASRFWTPLRVILAITMVTFGLGWVAKLPCRDGDWGKGNFYAYSRLCYSDVYALYGAEKLNEGAVPYVDHPVEYPVVIGGIMHAAASVVDVADPDHPAGRFYDVTSVMLGLCAAVVAACATVLAGRRRPWDAALFALAPGLILHGTTNWDLAAAALAAVGLVAWARRVPVLAGVLIGLATATKLYPILFFAPLLVLCVRSRRIGAWFVSAVTAIVTVALVYVPVYLVAGEFAFDEGDEPRNATLRFLVGNQDRPADWDSLWWVGEQFMRRVTDDAAWRFPETGAFFTLNRLVALAIVAVVLAVMALAAFAPRRPRVGQVLFLTVAGFLLANKVNSPQFTIWLIPLAVMARPRWGAFLTWQLLEIAVVFTRFYMFVNLGDPPKGLPSEWFMGAILLRDAALLTLMGLVVREMYRPDLDVVRRDGTDDPAGGVLLEDEPPHGLVAAPA